MTWQYTPSAFDGTDLTAGNFAKAWFTGANNPSTTRRAQPTEAVVVGRGSTHIRTQIQPTVWELHILLTAAAESDLQTFFKIFDEEKGSVFLEVDDDNAVTWRAAVVVQSVEKQGIPSYWKIVLRVANPTLETKTLDSASTAAMSGASGSVTPTNDGNRQALPVITIEPQTVKDTRYHDWKSSIRGFVVNRSPNWLTNYALQLFATADGAGTYDTAALVVIAATATTLDGAINATVTTITLADASNFDNDGMAYIDSGGTEEQVSYTSRNATQLLGVTRGVGGTTAQAHGNGDAVNLSRMLENGDDIVPWINGQQVERWLADMNSATTKLWVNLTMPPRLKLTSRATMTSGSPADGADWELLEDISALPESGQLVVDDELITYQGRDLAARKVTTIERGAWATTAAAHTTSDVVYRCDVLYILGSGKGNNTGQVEASAERRPAIQLNASLPNKHYYGDEANDASTVFYDADTPDRPMMFRPDFHVPSGDDNNAIPARLDVATTSAHWSAALITMGNLSVGRLVLRLDVPVEAVANGITYDLLTYFHGRMRILARDAEGTEAELSDEYSDTTGTTAGQQLTPADPLYELILNGVRAFVMGNTNEAGSDIALTVVDDHATQMFILDHDTQIGGVRLRFTGGTASIDFDVQILDDSGTDPEDGRVVWKADTGTFDETANLGELYTLSGDRVGWLAAGTYYLQVKVTAVAGGDISVITDSVFQTKHNRARKKEAGGADAEVGEALYFQIIHLHGGPVQPESEILDAGVDFGFDKLILELNDAAADNMVPQIRREASFGLDLSHCNAVLSNDQNSLTLTLDVWVTLTKAIEIDCDAQKVTVTDANHVMRLDVAVTPSDDSQWFALEDGANVITHTETDMTDTDIKAEHRGQKV